MLIRVELTSIQNALKTNFNKIKHSEIKTLVTNHFLDKYTNSKKNKQLQITSAPCTFILYLSTNPYPSQCLSLSFSVFLFYFLSFCLHPLKELDLILHCIFISLKFGC